MELMCGMTRLSVCQSVGRRTAEGVKACKSGKRGAHCFFFCCLPFCLNFVFNVAQCSAATISLPRPPALLVNLQLKAKHVLVASKCLFGAHPRCPEAFSKSSLRCPCICVCLSARPSSRCASFGQVEDTANGQGQQHVLLEYAIPRKAWRWNRE